MSKLQNCTMCVGPKWHNSTIYRNIYQSTTASEICRNLPLFGYLNSMNSSSIKNSWQIWGLFFQWTRVTRQTRVSKRWYIAKFFTNNGVLQNILQMGWFGHFGHVSCDWLFSWENWNDGSQYLKIEAIILWYAHVEGRWESWWYWCSWNMIIWNVAKVHDSFFGFPRSVRASLRAPRLIPSRSTWLLNYGKC